LLTPEELNWVNDYLKKVADTVIPMLSDYPDVADWMKTACAPF
ncbi:MAG TPA: hypothetical protein DDY27_02415, partial [Hyphomonadaceae bacterium]|nr:hypothetical protein [Hyphomonadaceae bacterium]